MGAASLGLILLRPLSFSIPFVAALIEELVQGDPVLVGRRERVLFLEHIMSQFVLQRKNERFFSLEIGRMTECRGRDATERPECETG
jgi:hypothetical protein